MIDRPIVIPRYMREDGKYIGVLTNKLIAKGVSTRLPFKDNRLEHILNGAIVSCEQTKSGLYSCLIELEKPAPQRIRDLYCFAKQLHIEVGEVRKNQLKIYSNTLFLLEIPFDVKYIIDENTPHIALKGNLVLEDDPGRSIFKYLFWLKLEKELSEEDYKKLKKMDIDDITNYL